MSDEESAPFLFQDLAEAGSATSSTIEGTRRLGESSCSASVGGQCVMHQLFSIDDATHHSARACTLSLPDKSAYRLRA